MNEVRSSATRRPGRGVARATIAAVAAAATLLAGCGVSAETSPTVVDPADVPFGLLDDTTVSSSTTPGGPLAVVYLTSGERLVAVDRPVPTNATLGELLDAVAEGATAQEAALGLSSSLPPDQVATVTSTRGVALVDLRASFATLSPLDQAAAIAQIVFTLTGRPGIGRVGFTLDGSSIEVPRGDGAVTTDALARDDFPGIVA